MKHKLVFVFLLFVFAATTFGAYRESEKDKKSLSKVNTNDLDDYIAINQILMYFSNNGMGSFNRVTDNGGFYWPGGENAKTTAIFRDGLIWGGKVGTEIRVGGNTYRDGLQAGPIVNGKPADPSDPKYRIYKARRGWEAMPTGALKERIAQDVKDWPVDDGAPWVDVDGDGEYNYLVDHPDYVGDEVNWMVMNDMDPARTTFLYGTQPMGMEVQVTIFGFARTGTLGDMVFKKYKFINKGINTIRDMVVAYWSDPDLGYSNDDFVGCDTLLSLGFVYNGNASDPQYGNPPPAAGYDFFQGPVIPYDPNKYPIILEKGLPDSAKFNGKWIKGKTNLPLTSFSFYINGSATYADPDLGTPNGAVQMYNYMTSKIWNGTAFTLPNTSTPVKYCLPGDPGDDITGRKANGWYEGGGWSGGPAPGDRRITMSSGPFTMAPGDTQEVVVGILMAKGASKLNSLTALKAADLKAQTAYDLNFKLTPPPPSPKVSARGLENKISLYWEQNSESYHELDPLVNDYYNFQGYELYQYADNTGRDPRLLATFDLADDIGKILDWQTVQGENVLLPVAQGTNSGLFRSYVATTDVYTNKPLNNGTPYYFGLVAYGYSPNSDGKVLKSTHVPIEVFPQMEGVDKEYSYDFGQYIDMTPNKFSGDGIVKAYVIDPERLTGDSYKVTFKKDPNEPKNVVYSLINVTKGDTLLRDQKDILSLDDLTGKDLQTAMFKDKKPVDGFIVTVANPGSLMNEKRMKEIVITQEAGQPVEPKGEIAPFIPRIGENIVAKTGKRGWWLGILEPLPSTIAYYTDIQLAYNFQALFNKEGGEDDYELRFVDQRLPYWVAKSGLTQGVTKENPLGKDSINIEFWNIGNPVTPKNQRLYIKSQEAVVKLMPKSDSLYRAYHIDITRLDKDTVSYDELFFRNPPAGTAYSDPAAPDVKSSANDYPIRRVSVMAKSLNPADQPKPGTIVRFRTWKAIQDSAEFTFVATKSKINDAEVAKNNLDKISVFPNPYFGFNALERDKYQRIVRFTNLPPQATLRIYNIAGIFIRNINKNDTNQHIDWDLRNSDGLPVASGMYLVYIDMPGIGSKILKLAVIQEKQFIDRL